MLNVSGSTVVFFEDRVETLEAVCADSKLEVNHGRGQHFVFLLLSLTLVSMFFFFFVVVFLFFVFRSVVSADSFFRRRPWCL